MDPLWKAKKNKKIRNISQKCIPTKGIVWSQKWINFGIVIDWHCKYERANKT